MKKVFLSVLTFIVLGIAMNAQANVKEEAPNAVMTAFNKLFPKATDLVWEQDELAHIVYFNEGETAKYCRLDATGKWLEKGVAITTDLPKSITDVIGSRYETFEIAEQYAVTLANKKSATSVIFSVEGEYIELLISAEGKVLRERFLPTQEEWEEEAGDEDDDWK
ncbi:MAG: hypothetical protein ACPGJS_17365 [Flammeovirgaceae bacterium]